MANQKITDLTAITAPGASDVLALVDLSGAAVTKKVTRANLLGVVAINMIMGSGTSVISTGIKGAIEMPFACTIEAVRLVGILPASTNGNLVVDIWKDSYANYPPTVADTITAAAKPTLAAARKYEDATLTGWTLSIATGDWLIINVDSAATLTLAGLSLRVRRA